MVEPLSPDGALVSVDGVDVSSRGLLGTIEVSYPDRSSWRSPSSLALLPVEVIADSDIIEQLSVTLAVTGRQQTRGGQASSAGQLSLTVPGPGSRFAQILLCMNPDQTLSWHLPEPDQADSFRAIRRYTYRLSISDEFDRSGTPPVRSGLPSPRKIVIWLFSFPLPERASQAAKTWEAKKRPYRLRSFAPDSYGLSDSPPIDDSRWHNLAEGPALLFVHGTGSRAHQAFGALPREVIQALHSRYGGRVFAWDHPTLADSPVENVRWFVEHLPTDLRFEVDILSHSRGGLVGRELAEGSPHPALRIRRHVMVATPNVGTALAARDNWAAWIDISTNLAQSAPGRPSTDTLAAALTVLKHLALCSIEGLDGLTAMDPHSDYLTQRLNRQGVSSDAQYFAVGSDYRPPADAPISRVFRTCATDLLFAGEPHDLIVPTAGTYAGPPPSAGFPIKDHLMFEPVDGVDHSGYWSQAALLGQLMQWLPG